MVFSSNGRIYYVSESVTSLLGYLPNELENTTIYDVTYHEDQPHLYNVLLNPGSARDRRTVKKGNFYAIVGSYETFFFTISIKYSLLNLQRIKYLLRVISEEVDAIFGTIPSMNLYSLLDIFVSKIFSKVKSAVV